METDKLRNGKCAHSERWARDVKQLEGTEEQEEEDVAHKSVLPKASH